MLTLADIVRAVEPAYVESRAGSLLASQHRALSDIARCRTAALGGSLYRCDSCDRLEYRYHSCRNRHCPTCQQDRAQAWLDRVRTRLLSCDHYLLTFTLPQELRTVARRHQRVVYTALMREAAAALQTIADDPRWVGGTLGILAVLHTWTRTLEYHPHVHLLVTAGGLNSDGRWVKPAHPRFLVPGHALSSIFRAKMRDALTRANLNTEIDPRVWKKKWIVHVEQIGTGEHAAHYLSRYVFRVALGNERLVRFTGDRVTFRYTHAATGESRLATLPVNTFLGRFLEHTLPRSFTKVRWYGLLSPTRRPDLSRARGLLAQHARACSTKSESEPVTNAPAEALSQTSVSVVPLQRLAATACPACSRGTLRFIQPLSRPRAPP